MFRLLSFVIPKVGLIAPENKLFYDYSFEKWKQQSGESIDSMKFPVRNKTSIQFSNVSSFSAQQDNIRQKIRWLLGNEPPGLHSNILHFYDRYPHWSVMGKMVADTRSVINDACTRMPFIDSNKIYLAGYSLGVQ